MAATLTGIARDRDRGTLGRICRARPVDLEPALSPPLSAAAENLFAPLAQRRRETTGQEPGPGDLQPALELSEDQVMQLKPVLGTALVDVVRIMWGNAGKKMRMPAKLKLANKLKKIQSTSKTQANEILTPEQAAKWEAMKEAAKAEE